MIREKTAAIALIVGALASVLIMALHPTGAHGVDDPRSAAAILNVAVHTLGIAALATIFAGTLAIPGRSGDNTGLAVFGVVAYGLAVVCGTLAAAMSGYVVPSLIERLAGAGESKLRAFEGAVVLAHDFNQSFAKLFTGATACAFLFWSAAIFGVRSLPRALAWSALAVGIAVWLGLATGHLRMNLHGFGAVVLAEAAWFVALGVVMLRTRSAPAV